MFKHPEDLSALDNAARLKVFGPALLQREPDTELQRLVEMGARVSGFPIVLVSLVVRDLQFFRAQFGLAEDLAIACATDRQKSFCQFVANSGKPLFISDTSNEPELPQDLINRYGIRAYFGFPVRVLGVLVGSFCVIDGQPRSLSQTQLSELEHISRQVEARLEFLAQQNRNLATDEHHSAWMKLAEQSPVLLLLERYAKGDISSEVLERGLGALTLTRDSPLPHTL